MNDTIKNIKDIETRNPDTVATYYDYYDCSVPKIVFVGADTDALIKGCADFLEGEGWFVAPENILKRPTASQIVAKSHVLSIKEMYEKEIQNLREEKERLNKIIDRLMND